MPNSSRISCCELSRTETGLGPPRAPGGTSTTEPVPDRSAPPAGPSVAAEGRSLATTTSRRSITWRPATVADTRSSAGPSGTARVFRMAMPRSSGTDATPASSNDTPTAGPPTPRAATASDPVRACPCATPTTLRPGPTPPVGGGTSPPGPQATRSTMTMATHGRHESLTLRTGRTTRSGWRRAVRSPGRTRRPKRTRPAGGSSLARCRRW